MLSLLCQRQSIRVLSHVPVCETLLLVESGWEFKQNLKSLQSMAAESPAAIKLVVGCLQQLRQAGQLRRPHVHRTDVPVASAKAFMLA